MNSLKKVAKVILEYRTTILYFGLGLGLVGLSLNVFADSKPGSEDNMLSRAWGLGDGYGVDAIKAWNLQKHKCGNANVVVAVIDTGIDMNHPALRDSLWTNKKELNGKPGVDNDNNGYVGDVHGWDFAKNSGKLSDSHGHGTHIAGIIAANEAAGLKGVCPGVRIMALRYYDPSASGDANLKNSIKAIDYAVQNGANIINYSGGGAEFSKPEFEALKRAEDKGILVVAAAGNEHSNADKNLYFPAAYPLTNIVSVTAVDRQGSVLPTSNWGVQKVHVAAPGNSILSSLPSGGYGFMTGTSQATAFVSGLAALIMTEKPGVKIAEVKSIIEASTRKYPQLVGKTKTGGEVSALEAMKLISGSKTRATASTNR